MGHTAIRVLLIESQEDEYHRTRDLLAEIDGGFEIDWQTDFEGARAALAQGSYDVCLLEPRLGQSNGLDLLRDATRTGYDLPVIVLTGNGGRDVDLQAMRAGAAGYLPKARTDASMLERSIRYALEQRRVVQRARHRDARARALLEHVSDAIISIDEYGIIEFFNPAASRLFGYAADEVIGRNLKMVMGEPYRSAHDEYLTAYLHTGVAKLMGSARELVARHKDGHAIAIELSLSEMHGEGRRTFIGTVRSIAERKQAEESLRTRARQHAALAEFGGRALASHEPQRLLDDAVLLLAKTLDAPLADVLELLPDGRSLQLTTGVGWQDGLVGAATMAASGHSLAAYVLRATAPVIIDDLAGETRFQPARLLLDHGVVSGASVIIRGHEQSFGILGVYTTTPRVFSADDVYFLAAVAALIAQGLLRHRAQAALRESEQRLQLTVDAANIGLWDWDMASGAVYYSPQWKAQLGYADDELENHPSLWEDRLHPDDREAAVGRLRDALRHPSVPYEMEFRLRHRDGTYRWIYARGGVLVDATGERARMFGAHVDITHRRQAEDAVRGLNAELEQRVAERTAQLEAANRELEAFSYSVSHDLRSPLRAIDGFAQALLDEYGDTMAAPAQHYLDRVRAGATRMGSLIDDLLALARVTRSEMRREDVDLSALAHEIAVDLRQRDAQRTVQFFIEPRHVVRGDPMLLRLALENLLGNAWKYTSKRAEARIAFGALMEPEERVFFIRDNGAGFDPAYTDKLFGPFQRLHGPGEFEGTGVGLATVQRIMRRHGGRVWAEGAVGEGATFFFTL